VVGVPLSVLYGLFYTIHLLLWVPEKDQVKPKDYRWKVIKAEILAIPEDDIPEPEWDDKMDEEKKKEIMQTKASDRRKEIFEIFLRGAIIEEVP